jgi:hypothetical protein
MAWARYGLYRNPFALANPAPYAEVAGRIPWDARSRYINRCLLN